MTQEESEALPSRSFGDDTETESVGWYSIGALGLIVAFDMDTVGSAVALASSHTNLMACGVHTGRLASRLVAQHHAPFRHLKTGHATWPSQLGGVIVVDAAAPDQTGVHLPDVPICVLDHHATDGWDLGPADCSLKWDVRSTTIMVAGYFSLNNTAKAVRFVSSVGNNPLSIPPATFGLVGILIAPL